jgi:hypothetical protein
VRVSDEDYPDEEFPDEGFPDDGYEPEPLDDHELEMIQHDLSDLEAFEAAFRPEGYRGVAVFCHDCSEEHLYPWDMLRENLTTLIETGETPVHEPAFAPEPDRYIPWDYARGYVDALDRAGLNDRLPLEACRRCGLELGPGIDTANFCPRCGDPLLASRLFEALLARGLDEEQARQVLTQAGLPGLA